MATFWFIVKIIAAILFVLTGGIVSFERFKMHWALVVLAALMAIGGAIYLFRDIYYDCAEIGWCRAAFNLDEAPPTLSIRPRNARQKEGNAGPKSFTFEVRRSGSMEKTVTVKYAVAGGSADADDFGGRLPSGTVEIEAQFRRAYIEIPVSGDIEIEDNEDFVVTLSDPVNAEIDIGQASGFILNDDEPRRRAVLSFRAGDVQKAEGRSGDFTVFPFVVRRLGPLEGPVFADWAVSPGDTDAEDFIGDIPSGVVTFSEQERTKTIEIRIAGDDDFEQDERFSVVLSNARPSSTTFSIATAAGIILNDDGEPGPDPVPDSDAPDEAGELSQRRSTVPMRQPEMRDIEASGCSARTPIEAAGDPFQECDTCPVMIPIATGSYCMGEGRARLGTPDGNTGPIHKVEIRRRFAVAKYELSVDQWAACVQDGGCASERIGAMEEIEPSEKGAHPLVNVSWHEAKTYVAWLSEKTGRTYRLLSESEWEYVARAGTVSRYSWGEDGPVCDEERVNGANFRRCPDDRTRPVTAFSPNPFGVHQMHGNVGEWVEDCLNFNYEGDKPDTEEPRLEGDCRRRVYRGGAWDSDAPDLRSYARFTEFASRRRETIGIRVARDLN